MRLGRPLVPLELTTEEQTLLESWARRRTTAQALALRARIVLRAAAGDSNTAIAQRERVTKATVGNYGTHKTARIPRWLAARRRFYIHFTPTSASWLNLVERWFALLTQKQIKRGAHRSTRELERAIREYVSITNEAPTPFIWTKTADQILASVARYCERIPDLGH